MSKQIIFVHFTGIEANFKQGEACTFASVAMASQGEVAQAPSTLYLYCMGTGQGQEAHSRKQYCKRHLTETF